MKATDLAIQRLHSFFSITTNVHWAWRFELFCSGRYLLELLHGIKMDIILYTELYAFWKQSQTPEDIEIFMNAQNYNKASTISQ